MHLDNWLAQRAIACPDRIAVVAGDYEVSYAELEFEAGRAARRLGARGVRRGSTVVIEMPAGLEHVVVLHALMKLGAIAYPLDARLAGTAWLAVTVDPAHVFADLVAEPPCRLVGDAGLSLDFLCRYAIA